MFPKLAEDKGHLKPIVFTEMFDSHEDLTFRDDLTLIGFPSIRTYVCTSLNLHLRHALKTKMAKIVRIAFHASQITTLKLEFKGSGNHFSRVVYHQIQDLKRWTIQEPKHTTLL